MQCLLQSPPTQAWKQWFARSMLDGPWWPLTQMVSTQSMKECMWSPNSIIKKGECMDNVVEDVYVCWQLSVSNNAALWAQHHQPSSACLHTCNAGSFLFPFSVTSLFSLIGTYISCLLLKTLNRLGLLLCWVCKSCLLPDLVHNLMFVIIYYRMIT